MQSPDLRVMSFFYVKPGCVQAHISQHDQPRRALVARVEFGEKESEEAFARRLAKHYEVSQNAARALLERLRILAR